MGKITLELVENLTTGDGKHVTFHETPEVLTKFSEALKKSGFEFKDSTVESKGESSTSASLAVVKQALQQAGGRVDAVAETKPVIPAATPAPGAAQIR